MDIKIFKTKKKFRKGGVHINPDIYWGLCLFSALLIIVSSMIFGFSLFRKINQELIVSEGNMPQIKKINIGRINSVLQYFSERKTKSSEIINSPSPIIDPSL